MYRLHRVVREYIDGDPTNRVMFVFRNVDDEHDEREESFEFNFEYVQVRIGNEELEEYVKWCFDELSEYLRYDGLFEQMMDEFVSFLESQDITVLFG